MILNFLKWTSETSSLRVCVFLFTGAICFYICWNAVAGRDIEWISLSAFTGVILGGKVIQKGIEEKNRDTVK